MDWLNYHHLLYFWMVAREGTITAACEKLRLAQPTVSAQLRILEKSLGRTLFNRVGRNLELTDDGRAVYRYANEIFALGQELLDTMHGRPTSERRQNFRVGVADVLPKTVVHRILSPALELSEQIHLICFEGKPQALLASLAIHEIDLVLSDSPLGPEVRVRAFNHKLGDCGVGMFGVEKLATRYRQSFPESLDRAPVLWPTQNTNLRREIDYWCLSKGIRPWVVAEFEDSALMKAFGYAGTGLFPAPLVAASEVKQLYGAELVGELSGLKESFYGISLERKIKNPTRAAVVEAVREQVFG